MKKTGLQTIAVCFALLAGGVLADSPGPVPAGTGALAQDGLRSPRDRDPCEHLGRAQAAAHCVC